MRVLAAEYSRLEVTAPQPLTLLGLRPSHGQAGSYPFGRRISIDKAAYLGSTRIVEKRPFPTDRLGLWSKLACSSVP
jgi:hypothetical protein